MTMAAIVPYYPNATATTGNITIYDSTDSYASTTRQDGWSDNRSQPSPARREDADDVVRANAPCLPEYWTIDEGVGGSQQSAPVYRLPTRRARARGWTGRNYHK